MPQRSTASGRTARGRLGVVNWKDLLESLRSTRPELLRSWFQYLRLTSMDGGLVEVAAPNAAQARYLEAHCKSAFTEAAQAVTGRLVSVTFTSPESNDAASDTSCGDAAHPERRPPLNPSFTLDRFVKGPCNQLAHSAAVAVAERPGEVYNPFFVYGAGGLGKTHLLQGIVHAAAGCLGDGQCLYVSSPAFVDDAIRSLENGRERELREYYGTVGLLAVDDAHLLAGRERSQEEFFHILNLLLASQRQIVLAADRSPPEIAGLQERLASRLSAGLVVALDAPYLETRMAIVRDKAALLAIHLTEEIVRLVAKRYDADVRQLTDALVRMDALSEFESSPITVELATRAIGPARAASATKTGQNNAVP